MKRWLMALVWMALSGAGVASPLATFVDDYAREHDFTGTVLIERDGEVVYENHFGLADRSHAVPNRRNTVYRIASITKLFTVALLMQAVEQGKVALDAPIGRYLPDHPAPARDQVHVVHLLNHTSGLRNMDQVTSQQQAIDEGLPPYQTPFTPAQMRQRFASGPLQHAPGSHFDYNNADYLLLQAIVEQAFGAGFEQVLREHILQPLELSQTGVLRQSMIVPRLASSYFPREDLGRLAPDLPVYPENWGAAGAMYSTVDDLRRFAEALYGGRLLAPASLQRILEPGLDEYGFGLWSYTMKLGGRERRVAKRPGQIMGAQGQLIRLPDDRVTVVMLSNAATTSLDEFAAAILRRLFAPDA